MAWKGCPLKREHFFARLDKEKVPKRNFCKGFVTPGFFAKKMGKSHDLRQNRRLEKQGTAQSELNWTPSAGGLSWVPGPGARTFWAKNHEAPFISWTGRANHPIFREVDSPDRGDRPVARSARRILGKTVEALRRGHRPMDFLPKGLAPRHSQALWNCQIHGSPAERGLLRPN